MKVHLKLMNMDTQKMVLAAGLEPARPKGQQIFIPATTFVAARKRLGSGLSLHRGIAALGAARLVSTPS
jgi:hypothetical protein